MGRWLSSVGGAYLPGHREAAVLRVNRTTNDDPYARDFPDSALEPPRHDVRWGKAVHVGASVVAASLLGPFFDMWDAAKNVVGCQRGVNIGNIDSAAYGQ